MIQSTAVPRAAAVRFAGDALLAVGEDGLVRVEGTTTAPVLAVRDASGPLAVSADGGRAFVASGDRVLVVDLQTAGVVARLAASGQGATCLAPSPDGRRVLVVGDDEGGTLKCFEGATKRASWTVGSVRYARVAWIDDDTFVTVWAEYRFSKGSVVPETRVQLRSAEARGQVVVEVGDPGCEIHEAVASSGRVLCATDRGVAWLEVTGDAAVTVLAPCGPVRTLAAAGDRAVAGGDDGCVRVVDLRDGSVTELEGGGPVLDVDLDPAGRVAWVIEDRVCVARI